MVKFNELNENSSEEDGENRKIAKPRRARVFSSSDDDEPCPETVQVNAESSSTEVNTADTTSYNVDASGKKTGSEDEKPQAVKSRLILSSDTESDESDDENSRKSDHTTAVANFENDRMEATSPSNDVVPDEKEEKLKNEFFKTVKCPTLNPNYLLPVILRVTAVTMNNTMILHLTMLCKMKKRKSFGMKLLKQLNTPL